MRGGAPARRHAAQKAGVHALGGQRAQQQRQRRQGEAGDAANEPQRRVVERQHGAKEHVQQIHMAAARGDDEHAQRQREQVEGGHARVFAQHRGARHHARGHGHQQPGQRAARRHGRQRQARQQVAHRCAGQDGVCHGVARQAHAAQKQEHAHRRAAQRQRHAPGQRPAHEAEFQKRPRQQRPQAGIRSGWRHGAAPWQVMPAGSPDPSGMRSRSRFCGVSTDCVGP